MDGDISAAIRAEQERRAEFNSKVAARIADGLCDQCAHGYHINHLTPGPILLYGKPYDSRGECTECPCEWV